MNASRSLVQNCLRRYATCPPKPKISQEPLPPKIVRLRENQKRFGIDDGVPVYLKGGLKDKLLFQATIGLVVIGLGMSFQTFYQLMTK